jgi:hypothetical protein
VTNSGRRVSILAAMLVGVAAGCGGLDTSTTPTPGATAVGPTATATAETPPTFGPPASPTPDEAAPVVVDGALLDLLPASIGTTPVQEDLDAAAQALSDPALDQLATGIDAAVAVDIGNGDLVYALVVHVKPGVFATRSTDSGATRTTRVPARHPGASSGMPRPRSAAARPM